MYSGDWALDLLYHIWPTVKENDDFEKNMKKDKQPHLY